MRVLGIDPGTVSIDVCGLDDGRVCVDLALPTGEALADPSAFLERLRAAGPFDLVAGPSGYGLPLVAGRDLSDEHIRLACLSAAGEAGGIGGLGALMRTLARAPLPVLFTPGVIHLPSVPVHRKINRVDLGTADKLCAAVLAVHEQAARRGCTPGDVSAILLELGGAFTASVAIEHGRIVDGLGGSSGPIGLRAGGALDGEVALLAGAITKDVVFSGGAAAVAGRDGLAAIAAPMSERDAVAREAYLEGAVKAVAALAVSAPSAREVLLSGRVARDSGVRDELARRLARVGPFDVHALAGFAVEAGHAAQGAALLADGLAGGVSAPIVTALGVREAAGTVLDHLYVVSPAAARARVGLS